MFSLQFLCVTSEFLSVFLCVLLVSFHLSDLPLSSFFSSGRYLHYGRVFPFMFSVRCGGRSGLAAFQAGVSIEGLGRVSGSACDWAMGVADGLVAALAVGWLRQVGKGTSTRGTAVSRCCWGAASWWGAAGPPVLSFPPVRPRLAILLGPDASPGSCSLISRPLLVPSRSSLPVRWSARDPVSYRARSCPSRRAWACFPVFSLFSSVCLGVASTRTFGVLSLASIAFPLVGGHFLLWLPFCPSVGEV